jgi:hypothetical protein
MTCLVIKSISAFPSQHFLYNRIAVKWNKLFYINKSSHPILWGKELHWFMQEEMLQLSSTQAACVPEPLLPGINNHICALQLNGRFLQTLNISYVILQNMYSTRPINTHFGKTQRTCMSYVQCLSPYHYTLSRAPTALSAMFAQKNVTREANTAFFRVIKLSQDLRSLLRDILMVVWVNSPIICPTAHFLCWTSRGRSQDRYSHLSTCTFPLLNVKGPFTSSILTSVQMHFSSVESQGAVHKLNTNICLPAHFLCWTSRGRSQDQYSQLSTCTFPLLNVKGPFTSSIHLSACTYHLLNVKGPLTSSILTFVYLHISSVERQGVVHKLNTHICLPGHFLCWTSRGRSQAQYSRLSTCTFPLLNVKGPFTRSCSRLPTCKFPSVERQGAVHELDTHICPPAHFPALTRKGAVSATHFHWPNTNLILLPS